MDIDVVRYEIPNELREEILKLGREFLSKSEAKLFLLTDDGGRLVAFEGMKDLLNETKAELLASIVSGTYSAFTEMGKVLKDEGDRPEVVSYEGKRKIVLIAQVDEKFLVCAVAPKEVALGRVRLYFKELKELLKRSLKKVKFVKPKMVKISERDLEKKLEDLFNL